MKYKKSIIRFGLFAGYFLLAFFVFFKINATHAAASLYVSVASSAREGDTISVNIYVNTNGVSANAFEANFSYPVSLFDGNRGSYSGSICTLPITQPEPSGGSATVSCGTPAGFTGVGKVATVYLDAKAAGVDNFGLTGCSVLANDGAGTEIGGGCSGAPITILSKDTPIVTPTPTATPTPNIKVNVTPTPKSTIQKSPTPTPKYSSTPKAAETPNATIPPPTVEASLPPVQALTSTNPETTPPPDSNASSDSQKRSIFTAIKDTFASLSDLKKSFKDITSLIAVMLLMLPLLALILAILYMLYRLYLMERRRRRTLDRLFEMELSEFAALEGKLDLLASKGAKGKDEYREEFRKSKENILRQLKPDFNKPVDDLKMPSIINKVPTEAK